MTDLQVFERIIEDFKKIVYGYKKPARKGSVKKDVKSKKV